MTLPELKAQCRWVLWRSAQLRPGKITKVPVQPNGCKAKSNDPATWNTYADCVAVASRFSGIGVVTGDRVVSVDLDDVIVSGKTIPDAMAIVTALDSYTEVTPSGTGLLVLACGALPGSGIGFVGAGFTGEIRDTGFFHTFTGWHLDGTPLELMPRQAEIESLYNRFRAPVRAVSPRKSEVPGSIARKIALLERWAEEYSFPAILFVKPPTPEGAVTVVLECCPRDPEHTGTSAGMVIFPDGGHASGCQHTSCRALPFKQWWADVETLHQHKLSFERTLLRHDRFKR